MTKILKTTLFALLVLSIAIPATSMAFALEQNGTATGTVVIQNSVNGTTTGTVAMDNPVNGTTNSTMAPVTAITTAMSPLKVQLEETTNVEELSCPQSSHVLILKQSDNSPACVTSSTGDKLVQRGWGTLISA